MLDILVTSRVRLKVLCLFVLNPDEKFYLRQVARELGEPVNSVRIELERLVNGGLIVRLADNNRAYFSFNKHYRYAAYLTKMISNMQEEAPLCQLTDFKRKRWLETELHKLVSEITTKYLPQKIILYGSLSTGKIKSTSDIDIIIVKDTDKIYYDRIRELVKLCDYNVGVDILIYTPSEFEQMKKNKFFREEILMKGTILYDKAA